jgi:hypothetical protein
MKTLIGFLTCALALSAASVDPKGEKELIGLLDTYKDALLHKDGVALARILSDDLSYTHSAGQEQTKAEVIESVSSGKSTVTRIEYSGTTVRVYGKTAVMKSNVDLWHSPTEVVHMNIIFVCVRGPQGWQIVARQATKLAK